ncbi:MAG: hypothetical protein M1818_002210 [Claussenomyces sp. TS43310]|nr:MAG: hypothetical protein M1818_002210 [Claussenomyces sp. TS43310]
MSHLLRHDGAPLDTQHSALGASPTTIGRPQFPSSPAAATSTHSSPSAPSDTASYRYGEREIGAAIGTHDINRSRTRSQHRAVPSPLQSSITATSPPQTPTPTRTTFANHPADSASRVTEIRRNPFLYADQPRSPKERLDDLLASERTFYKADDDDDDDDDDDNDDDLEDPAAHGIDSRHAD